MAKIRFRSLPDRSGYPSENRSSLTSFRLRRSELVEIRLAAKNRGMTISAYVRQTSLEAAREARRSRNRS